MKHGSAPERCFGLDLLRALAVLMVVFAHGSVLAMPLWTPGQGVVFIAFLGVELFFVLSGFLVGGLLLRELDTHRGESGQRWVLHFWSRRWLRTLPSYYLILLLNFAFVAFSATALPTSWPLYFVFSQNLVTPHPEFFGEAWSLAVEEWFYLLAPLAALAVTPLLRSRAAVLTGFLALFCGYLLLRISVVEWSDPAWDAGVRKLTALRLDSIAFGVLMAWLSLRMPELLRWPYRLATFGLSCVAACAMLFLSVDPDASLAVRSLMFSLAPLGCALLLPWANALRPSRLPKPLMRAIGQLAVLSYSLYLVHMFFVNTYLEWFDAPSTPTVVAVRICIFIMGALSAAWVLYRGFERPILQLRDRWIPR